MVSNPICRNMSINFGFYTSEIDRNVCTPVLWFLVTGIKILMVLWCFHALVLWFYVSRCSVKNQWNEQGLSKWRPLRQCWWNRRICWTSSFKGISMGTAMDSSMFHGKTTLPYLTTLYALHTCKFMCIYCIIFTHIIQYTYIYIYIHV